MLTPFGRDAADCTLAFHRQTTLPSCVVVNPLSCAYWDLYTMHAQALL